MKIAERIEREGKGCLVVVNKWDTIPNKNQQTAAHYEDDVREKLRSLKWAPIVYSTAITGHSVDKYVRLLQKFQINYYIFLLTLLDENVVSWLLLRRFKRRGQEDSALLH